MSQRQQVLDSITPREKEAWFLIASGELRKNAACHMGISHKTLDNHLTSLRAKLGLSGYGVAELTLKAIRYGVVTVEVVP